MAFGRLQKKLTPRKKNLTPSRLCQGYVGQGRKAAKKETGKEALINNVLTGAWSEAAEDRYSHMKPLSLCAFASWREILSSRKTLLGAIGS